MENSPSIAYKIIEFFTELSGFEAYALILGVLFVCGVGIPIPEDITLISAGILASMSQITLVGAMISGFLGVLVGDTLLFFIGAKFGRKVFKWPGFSSVFTPERIQRSEIAIQTHAKKICFSARFMPGLRAPIYLTSGILKVPFRTFIIQDGLAALLSVPVWVYLGYWFGENIDDAIELAKDINVVISSLILIGISIVVYFKLVKPRMQRKLTPPDKTNIKK